MRTGHAGNGACRRNARARCIFNNRRPVIFVDGVRQAYQLQSLQFESGFNETAAGGQRGWDLPEILARFGATSMTELRLALPDVYWNTEAGSAFASGAGDLSASLQQQLGLLRGFAVSTIAALSLPSGSRGVSSGGYDATLQLPWSRKLSGWTAAGMFQVSWPTVNGGTARPGLRQPSSTASLRGLGTCSVSTPERFRTAAAQATSSTSAPPTS